MDRQSETMTLDLVRHRLATLVDWRTEEALDPTEQATYESLCDMESRLLVSCS